MGLAFTKVPSSEFGSPLEVSGPSWQWTELAGYKLESFIHSPHLLLTLSSHPHPLQIWKLLETRLEVGHGEWHG